MERMEAQMQDRYEAYDDAMKAEKADAKPIGYCVWINGKLAGCSKSHRGSFPVYAASAMGAEMMAKAKNAWTQELIDAAPASLRMLGEMLSNKLTDDEWNNVEPLLVSVSSAMASAGPLLSIAKRWNALDGGSWNVERHAREKAELLNDTKAAIAKATPSQA